MNEVEDYRIKVFKDRLIAGIMSKRYFHSMEKYWAFGSNDPQAESVRLGDIAQAAIKLGFTELSQIMRDGGGDPHTLIFTKKEA